MDHRIENRLDPFIGQVMQDRYSIEKVLGAGGMGRVYLALDFNLERRVALKVLHAGHAQDGQY